MDQLTQTKINTLDKGLILDTSSIVQPEGTYRYALNAVNESIEGDILFLTNELSNTECAYLPDNHKYLGSIYISYIDKFVIFSTNNTDSTISMFDAKNCSIETIISSSCLNFTSCSYIEGTYTTLSNCGDIIIYWTDNVNPIRYLNISKPLPLTTGGELDCEKIVLFDCFVNPDIQLLRVVNSGGILETGVYFFSIRYTDIDGNYTNWLNVSNPIPIYDDNTNAPYSSIDGSEGGVKTNKSIDIKISGLDPKYNQIDVAVVSVINGITELKFVNSVSYSSDILFYTFTGHTLYTLSFDEFLTPSIQYTKAKTMIQKDNELYIGNLQSYKNINYQKFANQIKVDYVTTKIPIVSEDGMGYKTPYNTYFNKSWLRDEVYALGIVWEFCDGTYSPVFHIPGREMQCFDTMLNHQGISTTTDYEGFPLCDDFLVPDDNNVIDCDLDKWKNRNTAIRTFYSDCDTGAIDFNILYPAAGGYHVYTDLSVDLTAYYGTIVDTTDVYNKWFINFVGLSAIEATQLLADLFVLLPTLPVPDDCALEARELCILSKGKMGYYQSCQRYPLTKDCNGDYMYPTETDSNGNVVGQYIRHHRMPDVTIEPHFSTYSDPSLANRSWLEMKEGNNQNKKPYANMFVHPLGISVENIQLPDDVEQGLVKGYKIVYVKRDDANKTVVAKGISHGCFMAKDENNRQYFIPKHGINSYEYFNHPSIEGTHAVYNIQPSLDDSSFASAYTFISPNTTLIKSELNVDYIKIEGELYGKGDVYGDFDEWDNDDLFCEPEPGEPSENWGRRQNYNINNLRFSNPSNTWQVNRSLKGAVYLNANEYTDDSVVMSLPVDNRNRESSVYLELESNKIVDRLRLVNFYNDYEGAVIPGIPNSSIQDSDTSFWKNSSLIDVRQRAQQQWSAATWYISLKRNNCNIYSNLSDLIYIDTGLRQTINQTDSVYATQGISGDTFINYWAYRRTSRLGRSDNDDNNYAGVNFKPRTLKTLVSSIVESDVNAELRHEGTTALEIYYPKLNNGVIALDSAVPNEARPYNAFLNQFYYNTCSKEVEGFADNYWAYNEDYSSLIPLKRYFSIPINYNTCDCVKLFDTHIAISNRQDEESGSIGFKKFNIDNKLVLPKNTGPITGLYMFNDLVYAHTLDSTWRLLVSNQSLQTDENTVFLGTAGITSQKPIQMYATNEGYAGCKNTWEHITNQYGHFWVDSKGKKIFRQTEGFEDISNAGISKWFYNNSELCNESCGIVDGSRYVLGFDHNHKRLLLTKHNECEDCDKSWTLSYSLLSTKWASFHAYVPDAYLYNRVNMYSIKNNGIWLHGNDKTSYQTFYDVYYPFIVEIVQIDNAYNKSILNDIRLITDAEQYDILSNYYKKLHNTTFDKVIIYNNRGQCSGELDLITVDKQSLLSMSSTITNDPTKSRIYKNEGIWQINNFTDLVSNYNIPLFISNCSYIERYLDKKLNTAAIDYSKYWGNKQPFRDSNVSTRLMFTEHDNVKLSFQYYLTNTTKSIK